MSPRYLLIVAQSDQLRAETVEQIVGQTDLVLLFSSRMIAVLAHPSCGFLPVGNTGCVLGSLFHRRGLSEQLTRLTFAEAGSIASSDGEALLCAFWGGYIAAIERDDCVTVLRDPSGTFPCYYASRDGLTVFASDAELLVRSGVAKIDIDLDEIGRQLFRSYVPAPATALRGIDELLPGFSVRVPITTVVQKPIWSPWNYVSDHCEGDAADRLSRVVAQCVGAWGSTQRRLLLSVSGGLDSSIIAACLARSGADPVCLNMYTDDPAGDEREFARAVCNQLGLTLIERAYRLEDIDISDALATQLPSPRDRTQAIAFERTHLRVAAEVGADAFMIGHAGDHVFGYSQSAAPIADRYLSEGLGSGVWRTLIDVCRQTGSGMVDALGQAWRLTRGSPNYRVRPNTAFLNPDFIAELGAGEFHHPWLDAPAGALPGKAAHIATILRAQPVIEHGRGGHFPVLTPLLSQPIVEVCLGISTWQWRTGGRDRSLARQAFSRDLPPVVLNRRIKGTPGRFAALVLDHFRGAIRERLVNGRLASAGITDAVALDRSLSGERPVPGLERVRLLELANIEAWIEHWASRRKAAEPAQTDINSRAYASPPLSTDPMS